MAGFWARVPSVKSVWPVTKFPSTWLLLNRLKTRYYVTKSSIKEDYYKKWRSWSNRPTKMLLNFTIALRLISTCASWWSFVRVAISYPTLERGEDSRRTTPSIYSSRLSLGLTISTKGSLCFIAISSLTMFWSTKLVRLRYVTLVFPNKFALKPKEWRNNAVLLPTSRQRSSPARATEALNQTCGQLVFAYMWC